VGMGYCGHFCHRLVHQQFKPFPEVVRTSVYCAFFSWSCMLNQSGILFRIVFRHEDPESYLAGKVSNGGTKTRSQTYDHDGRCISAAMWEQNEALWRPTGEETQLIYEHVCFVFPYVLSSAVLRWLSDVSQLSRSGQRSIMEYGHHCDIAHVD
jgi:hypothetical protein